MISCKTATFAILALFTTACSSQTPSNLQPVNNLQTPNSTPNTAPIDQAIQLSADEHALKLFDTIYEERVALSPEWQTSLGRDTQKDLWDEHTDAATQKWQDLAKSHLKQLQHLGGQQLNHQNQLSLSLLTAELEDDINNYSWRYHGYPINQMFGVHSGIPSLLMNQHDIQSIKDAEDYIARLNGVKTKLTQVNQFLQEQRSRAINAPKFVFTHVLRDCNNLLQGKPFEINSTKDSALLADFKQKIDKLALNKEIHSALVARANSALKSNFFDGYSALITQLKLLEKEAPEQIGVWQQPDGDNYYQLRLKQMTTTNLSAEAIHHLGLSEVERVHTQMRNILKDLKFKGSLQDFFAHLRTDTKFTYPNTQAGKKRYLNETQALITEMKKALPTVFNLMPKADLIVQPVEPFREKSAGKAFYEWPSSEGDRPGIYYVNLFDMNNMPWYQMEALAYHEALPGHHMQIAIAQELEGIPKFRRFGGYTAYSEGWGLYAEFLPKEMGFYQNPYSDFGRLAWELWRSTRLVVDTGIHYKRWTKNQAIDYLIENTPNPKHDIERAVERYAVMPAQATTYKIGMIKILELRERAKVALGVKFDIRDFHDVILKDGALPLDILEQQVDAWIASFKI